MCWNLFRILPPTVAVCKNHVAPLDVVWSIYNQEKSTYVVVGSRGSGKTTCIALLQVLFSLTFSDIEVCNTAAALHQSRRCYEEVKKFLFNPQGKLGPKIVRPYADEKWSTMWATKIATGSTIFITTLTEKGTNAPHPQKLFIDEVELADNRKVIEEALSMPQSKGDATRQVIYVSSWKKRGGFISQLVETHKNNPDAMVAFWCVFEAMKPIPDHAICEKNIRQLPDGTTVSFADVCRGRAHVSRGFIDWRDVLTAFRDKMDFMDFRAQWLSEEPAGEGLNVFHITDKSEIKRWDPVKYRGCPIYAGVDYGWSAPTAIVLAQVVPKVGIIVFKEYAYIGMSTAQVAQACLEIEKELRSKGLHVSVWVVDPRAHHLLSEEFSRRYLVTAAPFPDKGVLTPSKHEKLSRVTIVNNLLSYDYETGLPKLFFVADQVPLTLKQVKNLSYAVDSEGNPTDKIPDGNDDFVDALLYLVSFLDKVGYAEVLRDLPDPEVVGENALREIREQLNLKDESEVFLPPADITDENEQRELLRGLIQEKIKRVISQVAGAVHLPPEQLPEVEEELVKRTEQVLLSEMNSVEAVEKIINNQLPPEVENKLLRETVRMLDRLSFIPEGLSFRGLPTPDLWVYEAMLQYLLGESNPFLSWNFGVFEDLQR